MLSKKTLSLSIAVIVIALMAFTPRKNKREVVSAKLIDKNLAKISDSLYAYRYEASNYDYLSFLWDIQKSNPSLYERCIWDSLVWRSELTYCEPLVEYYQRHPGFFDYPVVGVSYEAALEYCKWLSDLYNADPKRKFNKVQFVLPAQAQWEEAARAGRSQAMYPWGNYYLRNKKGEYLCNFKRISETAIVKGKDGRPVIVDSIGYIDRGPAGGLNDRAFYTANVKSFYPNDFGIYNICGNVAEMVAEKGICKGGGFRSYGGEVHIRAVGHYEDAAADLGFRVFMKVIEKF
jgi:formylglycine-generating enzyme required for sulfatase activity